MGDGLQISEGALGDHGHVVTVQRPINTQVNCINNRLNRLSRFKIQLSIIIRFGSSLIHLFFGLFGQQDDHQPFARKSKKKDKKQTYKIRRESRPEKAFRCTHCSLL